MVGQTLMQLIEETGHEILEHVLAELTADKDTAATGRQRVALDDLELGKSPFKKIDVGAAPPESLISVERELLRIQRGLAATRKGRAPLPARSSL